MLCIYLFQIYLPIYAQSVKKPHPVNNEIPLLVDPKLKLSANNNPQHLNYPAEVELLYREAGKQLIWIAPDTVKTHASDAMMMLDCVLQYGLNRDDYHSKELLYDKLNLYTSKFSKTNFAQKSRFDKLLTDAMLTFINDLHYGKLNPGHRPSQIDGKGFPGFSATSELLKALRSEDFDNIITGVQPQSKAYTSLQYRMHLLEGRVTAECYSLPESEIRKMAINMERLRWLDKNELTYIQVNIPSLTLTFITPDSAYKFKVMVGKPASPTLARQDMISFFITQQKGSADPLIFQLNYAPKTTIRGVSNRRVFNNRNRAITTGFIAVDQPDMLAALLLKYDGSNQQTATFHQALVKGERQKFSLSKPVPVIVTYLTLEINKGIITSYRDIYKQDKGLEMALYNRQPPLVVKNKSGQ